MSYFDDSWFSADDDMALQDFESLERPDGYSDLDSDYDSPRDDYFSDTYVDRYGDEEDDEDEDDDEW